MDLNNEELNNPIVNIELVIEDIRKLHDTNPEYNFLKNMVDLYYDVFQKYANCITSNEELSSTLVDLIVNNKHHQTIKKYKRYIIKNNASTIYYKEQLKFLISNISIIKTTDLDKLIEIQTDACAKILNSFNDLSKDINYSEKKHNNYKNKIKTLYEKEKKLLQ
jgi:hypothetical protein